MASDELISTQQVYEATTAWDWIKDFSDTGKIERLLDVKTKATRTSVDLNMTSSGKTLAIMFVNNAYYLNMELYQTGKDPAHFAKVTARLPGSAKKFIKFTKRPKEAQGLYKPEDIFSNTSESLLSLDKYLFPGQEKYLNYSEVTQSPNETDATMTDYTYVTSNFAIASFLKLQITRTTTFDSNGLMRKVKEVADVEMSGVSFRAGEMISTQTVGGNVTITAPPASKVIAESKVTNMSNKILAEEKSRPKANAIVKKAAALAKKAKQKVNSKHLSDAVKALKYSATKITNGVKLTATVSKVKGSLCVTAVKGKTSIKNC